MPTPAEQKALAFFAIVILLGGAARVLRAGPAGPVPPADAQALDRQLRAVDSAGRPGASAKKRPGRALKARSRRDGVVDTVAGVVGIPFSDVRPDPADRRGWVNGYPPASPRVDVVPAGGAGQGNVRPERDRDAGELVDVDVATAGELEALPGVGPAMAARLVANRDSFGAFRTLEGLRRVRGMGPATVRRLAPRVTFSSRAASSSPKSRVY
jgi:competence ComEA-like helix-hairpin-helix protein